MALEPPVTLDSVADRLDRVPLTGFHWRLLVLAGFGWMFDAMDILLVGSVIAAVSREWGLDAATATLISSINLLGMFVGASLAGSLSDRYGRKTMFQTTLLIYSLFTGLSALAFNAVSLMILRFLAGVGLGGELPVASTLLSEFAPARNRGTLVVLLESFWAYGSVLAALIAFLVIPSYGWQIAFLIGALPALYVFALRRGTPESPRFLMAQGRVAEAYAVVEQVEVSAGVKPVGHSRAKLDPPPAQAASFAELFRAPYLRRTIVLWAMWATMNFSYYGIFLWLPLQFVRKGFSLDQALLFNLIIAIAQIPGYFAAALLVERWGRKPTLVSFLLACAIGAWFFGQVALEASDVGLILFWGSVISFFNLGAWGVVYTYTPELYPTRLRGTGAGWAAAFGRIWGILAPLSISLQLALFGSDITVFLVFMAVMLLGAVIVLALGEETRGRSLEQIASA
jgi:MFS transporter, putative metabolite:H+ symporter